MIKGLVLEGGGAKGAYQASVLNALCKEGYKFDIVIGASIGALNGAMYAQQQMDKCMELWKTVSASSVVDIDDAYVQKVVEGSISKQVVGYFYDFLKKAVSGKGLKANKVEAIIDDFIDEETIRSSNIDFGLVTVEWKSGISTEPYIAFKKDIPQGKLKDFIMASATFPAFQPKIIDGKRYIDGGIYDNMPIKPLVDMGVKDILVIRTNTGSVKLNFDTKGADIKFITPQESAGSTIGFVQSKIKQSIKMGEYDAKKFIHGYVGYRYYLKPTDDEEMIKLLAGLDSLRFKKLAEFLKINPNLSKRTIIRKTANVIEDELKLEKNTPLYLIYISMFEIMALKLKIEKYEIYTIEEFLSAISKTYKDKNYPSINVSARVKSLIGFDKIFTIFNIIFGDLKDE